MKSVMRKRLAVCAVVTVCLLASAGARASVVLDQYQEDQNGASGSSVTILKAQTFTAGVSGLLDHVDLGNTSGTLWLPQSAPLVEIVDTVAGQPGATVLGSVASPDVVPNDGWLSIDFVSQAVNLTAGQMYAIVLYPVDPDGVVTVGAKWDPASYGPGAHWMKEAGIWTIVSSLGPGDIQFRTFMQTDGAIPAPGAIVLGMMGTGLVGWLRRRHAL